MLTGLKAIEAEGAFLSHDELGKMADAIEKVLGNLDALR